jgi:hypothetical protein
MANYTVYRGQFLCHTCKVEVGTLRLYPETQEVTWMCPEKHLSKVSFARRKKKDFEREE